MPVENAHRPSALDRVAQGIVSIGESRRTRMMLASQPLVYADFVRRGIAEGMPFISAALHPFLVRLGGVDQVFTNPETANQMVFAIELAELNTIGIATTVAVGASALSRYSRVFHGELPVHDPDGVIFLAAGSSDLLADSFGEALINKSGTQRPRNVYFSALYNQTDPRPTLPEKGFQRRHYIAAYDRRLKVTDSRELQLTGVFNAKTVVIATDSHQALEDIAITIHGHSHGQTRIIPVAVDPLNMHACEIDDINNGNRITLTERPVNPYVRFARMVNWLTSPVEAFREIAIADLTAGLLPEHRELRQEKLRKKTSEWHQPKIYLDGMNDEQLSAFKTLFPHYRAHNPHQADIIISFGADGITNDLAVSASADELRRAGNLNGKVHLFFVFSWGNEDSAGYHAEAGASIQRLCAEELVERLENEIVFSPPMRQRVTEKLSTVKRR